ncbi:hypothetical protein GALMADRAFT_1073578 [Galerina marginata CBS 339.88]|uniref:MYND-type domain-containing protein n=1 Tax=Galerina marginata (strain CBS 339.88) TaxID=685588 RepID=A0A067SLP5_GALM3|nr:hypothetical protein GALMADRAFT_1073578 [Galerina marginata CBS 339.88]
MESPTSPRPRVLFSHATMIVDYRYYREVLSRIKRPMFSIANHSEGGSSSQSLESFMSYGLGSGVNGKTISQVPCSNASSRALGTEVCSNIGLMACSQCSLVKYCSGRCQRQHWSKHRLDCEHIYVSQDWEPEWMVENRQPLLSDSKFLPPSSSTDVYKNVGHLPYDALQLQLNEGPADFNRDFKICMTAASDIRNLVETVNSLPNGYSGRLDILLNNSNAIVLNRMFVILCVLLTPGPSIEESAELATHLMYSASLPETAASHIRHCINLIYGEDINDGEMSFQTTLKTRGSGKLYSAQPAASIKRPMEMFSSTYGLAKATNSMKETLQDPFQIDDRQKMLSTLSPVHRLALDRFWQTGVLAPFSLDLRPFKSPNRLMFTPQGEWSGFTSAVNPLHGWDVSAVRRTGRRYGLDPAGDILGCLFFHIKSELREFSLRVKGLNINIHLLQYDSRLLSKGISIGVLPAFSEASFDRIDVGDMGDQMGVAECLADWGPLLNKKNPSSCLLMHSKKWHEDTPSSIARHNPRAVKVLMERCESVPSLKSKLKTFFKNPQAPSLVRLMASLDAFVDHEAAFLQYLEAQEAQGTGASLGLALREAHCVHPKRVGIPLHSAHQKLPNLSKEEFYDYFTIGGSDLTIRFAEFEYVNFA